LDIGAFVAGLESVTGHTARVVGKPSLDFFRLGMDSLGLPPEHLAMVGDDIDSDVGGGQAAGLHGILVRTGKYRQDYVEASGIRPDMILDSFADLPGHLRQAVPAEEEG
jgi:ribonucleotide monophosphatase NagD (HAD superfamily)